MKPKNKKQADKIFDLLNQRIRCLIFARHGYIGVDAWGDYFNKALKLEDDIIEEIYGSSNLITLGKELGLLDPPKQKSDKPKVYRRKKKKKRD